jgi:murein L,D-transpeptidase YcbB/YkuD
MNHRKRPLEFIFILLSVLFFSCGGGNNHHDDKDIVKKPAQMEEHMSDDLKKMLMFQADNGGKLNDSIWLNYGRLLSEIYDKREYSACWSDKERWLPAGDSLYDFIVNAKEYGLFPSDYHYPALAFIHRVLKEDETARHNVLIWARADLMLTDAFFSLAKDLKLGRLKYDSVSLRTDTAMTDDQYSGLLAEVLQPGPDSVAAVLQRLEPKFKGYDSLKAYTHDFLTAARFRNLTYLDYPFKDTAAFYKSLGKRLKEVGYIDSSVVNIDTALLAGAIRNYQHANDLKVTGKVSGAMITMMDNNEWEKFKRIAINLDRYKLLPDSLPDTYVWVNLPGFFLQVIDSDTVVFDSRIIVGAPKTRTPLLTSEITNFITFPQWTVPESIIFKEMLPKIKQDTNFLRKENLMVVDKNDSVLDPSKINWKRLNKNNFPYQLRQRQGDDNSLGVMKFNFRNKYDVYMHDTNARWLFGKSFRALSHGCVRVKEWQKLSGFLVRNDTARYKPDTLKAWIRRQEKHTIYGFQRVPVFLRYFAVEGKKGKVVFHDDIYGEDKILRDRYFANKPIY